MVVFTPFMFMSKTNTKYTSQHIDNQSFDEDLQVRVTELIGADGVLKNPATSDLQSDTLFDYKLARLPVPGDTLTYLGYLRKDGAYYITEIDETTGTQKYIKGDSDIGTAWSNRASLTYLDFNEIF